MSDEEGKDERTERRQGNQGVVELIARPLAPQEEGGGQQHSARRHSPGRCRRRRRAEPAGLQAGQQQPGWKRHGKGQDPRQRLV